jgi:hypothetical protein
MSKITELAAGQITHSPHNTMMVEPVEPEGMPAVVRIGWPVQHTSAILRFDEAPLPP